MTKDDFVKIVEEEGGYETKKDAQRAIKAFTTAVTKALTQKENISLIGFGSFITTLQKGKTGKIPGTEKTYTTKDRYVPKFRAGKALKDAVAKE